MDVMSYAPSTWNRSYTDHEIDVPRGTEFNNVEHDVKRAIKNARRIVSLTRVQHVHDFGQFLMRGQIVAHEPIIKYYEVRRYVEIPQHQREIALQYNLDHRRLDMDPIQFKSHLENVKRNSLIFIVKILTTDPRARQISPYNFTEYYIEYVAQLELC